VFKFDYLASGFKVFFLKSKSVMNHHFVMSIVLEQENFVFDGTSSNDQIHCPDGQSLSP
jgi:hypothetical protein